MYEYFVYLLECADKTIYVGVTNDYQRRLYEHQAGLHPDSYTFTRRPVKLVYVATFNDIHEAISWEKHVKRWSNSKKAALAEGDEAALHVLAKKKFPPKWKRYHASIRSREARSTRHDIWQLCNSIPRYAPRQRGATRDDI
ncbi:GIY-YIG nuclease family protein [Candidatus Peribacteria bacterium]|nr:GIY-YIG nuclease family protein [Candidatus Peribacteria bacterium]